MWIEHFFESFEGKCQQLLALRYKVIWYSAKKYDFPLKIIERQASSKTLPLPGPSQKMYYTYSKKTFEKKTQKLGPKEWLSG